MKKKVAILSSYLFNTIKEIEGIDRPLVDGASRYLIELCKMLEENDFEVTIVYPIKMTDKLTSPIEKDYFGFRGFAVPLPDGVWELNVCVPLNSVFNELTMNFDLRIYFAPFVA
ncbi:MAG: hypothetical protein N2323_07715, partial [candidate division WOR-3 bacterium]|nr:hypothetical protein [candidate division WOR-3 bacterium]